MASGLSIVVAVILSAVAVIGVILWRLRPFSSGDVESLKTQLLEANKRGESLQDKLESREALVASLTADAAAARAGAEAADKQAAVAEQRLATITTEQKDLTRRWESLAPQVERANAENEAARREAKTLQMREDSLVTDNNNLRIALQAASDRAAGAERAAAGHQERALAAEEARAALAAQLTESTRRNDTLSTENRQSVERMAAAETASENLRSRMGEMGRVLETLQMELTAARNELFAAVTKNQGDEDAVRQFESISQRVLKDALEDAKRGMSELALSLQKSSGEELHKHAEQVTRSLEPLQDKLREYDEAVESLKKNTQEAYGGLREQISELNKAERSLHDQAQALTNALSASPKVKGAYGELVLQQLVEFAGMQERCHFEKQASRDTDEGRKIPDMVIALPGGQKVLVDAKAVMEACVDAYRATDESQRVLLLRKHCQHVRSRIVDLSAKNYFADHKDAVEAVVLFLPAENLYAAAVENDVELTEFAMRRNILVCGPNSLLMLLKVATQLWRRASIEEEAQQIAKRGSDVYKWACDFVDKFAKIGTKIQQLSGDYNDAAGTLDSRLIPAGRDLARLNALTTDRSMEDISRTNVGIREFRSQEARKQMQNLDQVGAIASLLEAPQPALAFPGVEG